LEPNLAGNNSAAADRVKLAPMPRTEAFLTLQIAIIVLEFIGNQNSGSI